MKDLRERVHSGNILVADGAMGTMLMARGYGSEKVPEMVNLECPEILEEIARMYIKAGADIVQTNTFGASPLKLEKSNLSHKMKEINAVAVQAARTAAGAQVYVCASVGPTGRVLKPYGDAEPEAVKDSYVKQLEVLVESGVDAVCIETMTDLSEAILALEAAKKVAKEIPIIVTMTFEYTSKGFYTVMGASIERSANELESRGADIIGSNCGNGIEKMVMIAREFRKYTKLPIIVQPNAGLPQIKNGKILYPETPEFFSRYIPILRDIGVSIIGGCCGTTPDHIAIIRNMLNANGVQQNH
ncbi:MAG: homocysteine S-methyltransferase family protein [Spirochaetes bacterium]|nr:homocysteine S-methyltransferase family protein [Spirochaetota bacterium]